ncbi:MAG: serine hydrolase domain-containing protein [Pseudomonadota bacterium]
MEIVEAESIGLSSHRLAKLNGLMASYIDSGKYPGTTTLVARHGKVAHLSFQGKSDVENDANVARDTIFRIYSMSKPITSTALMMLYEDGHFMLDDPVSRYIPGWDALKVYTPKGTVPTERPMQIRDLLTHTSGLTYGFMNAHPVDGMYRDQGVESAEDLTEMVKRLGDIPLLFSPGTRWSYSVATDVCGYLVQKIADQSFDEFLIERLFQPLGMVDTDFWVPADKAHRLAANYNKTPEDGMRLVDPPGRSTYLTKPSRFSGGGGLVSTIDDYFRFAQMLLNKGELDGARILGRKTVELMTSNHMPGNGDLASMGQSVFSETPYDGIGFGLGFSVMLDPPTANILGTPGEFAWGGAASTYFFVDPREDLLAIQLTQLLPSSAYPVRRELRVLTYQSLID